MFCFFLCLRWGGFSAAVQYHPHQNKSGTHWRRESPRGGHIIKWNTGWEREKIEKAKGERRVKDILIELLGLSLPPLSSAPINTDFWGRRTTWDLPRSPRRRAERGVHLCNSRVWETIPQRTENPQQLARLSLSLSSRSFLHLSAYSNCTRGL